MPNAFSVAPTFLWVGFSAAIMVLLLIDLSLFHREDKAISVRGALLESGFWIALALSFNAWFWHSYGSRLGLEFLTGYLVEKSLSIDNLFIILLVFGSFRIPAKFQHRVLFYGVLGAIVMRGILIVLGAQLLHRFHWIIYIFGAILLITAVRFLVSSDEQKDVSESFAVRTLKRWLPITSETYGHAFFVHQGGVRKGTPLLLALVVIEFTDLIFAVDSIPAVFAVTQDTFVAFASNVLALLGLRALYFALAEMIKAFRYLKPGLSATLAFVGGKMLLSDVVEIPSWVSFLVIAAILATAGLSSWYVNRLEERRAAKRHG